MKISVITPSYNYSEFLPDAIESVSQFADVEHLIQDNCSNDGTFEILKNAGRQVRWVVDRDGGQSDALNRAICRASGEIVGWLNADDAYLPSSLDRVREFFMAHPKVDIVYGDTIFLEEESGVVKHYAGFPWMHRFLRSRSAVLSTSAFVRRAALNGVSLDTNLRYLMDWDFFLQLQNKKLTFAYIPIPIAIFRLHARQVTNQGLPEDAPERVYFRKKHHIYEARDPRARAASLLYKISRVLSGAVSKDLKINWRHATRRLPPGTVGIGKSATDF